MQIEVEIEIAAPVERIWAVMNDVEGWPRWTASISQVELLEEGAFGLGSRARVRQPRIPSLVWRVSQYEPGHGFVWETRNYGAHTVGEHWITPKGGNICIVSLKVRQTGLLVPIFAPWMTKITRDYMNMEAQGLKRRSEIGAPAEPETRLRTEANSVLSPK